MLVDEEHLVLARRDDERILQLADDIAESTRAERRDAFAKERALDVIRRWCARRGVNTSRFESRFARHCPNRRGQALLRLNNALGAQRILDGAEDRLLDETRRAKPQPRRGRVDID